MHTPKHQNAVNTCPTRSSGWRDEVSRKRIQMGGIDHLSTIKGCNCKVGIDLQQEEEYQPIDSIDLRFLTCFMWIQSDCKMKHYSLSAEDVSNSSAQPSSPGQLGVPTAKIPRIHGGNSFGTFKPWADRSPILGATPLPSYDF